MNKNIIIRNNESETIKDIEMKSLLSLEEELNLVKQVKDGDEEALNKLCTSNIRLVTSVAKQYADKGLSLDELIKAGNRGLEQACRQYDPSRDIKLMTYALWFIRQSIEQALENVFVLSACSSKRVFDVSEKVFGTLKPIVHDKLKLLVDIIAEQSIEKYLIWKAELIL